MPTVPNSTLTLDNLPQGVDRADGLGGRLGTATINLSVSTPDGGDTIDFIPINEAPDSPTIERAEQATCTHKYTLSYNEGINRLNIYGRGTLVRDSFYNYWRVLSTSLQRVRGDSALLTVTVESVSFDNPPDEFQITPVKLGIDILKHPRYFYALMPSNQISNPAVTDTPAQIAAKQSIIRAIQVYRDSPFAPQSNTINSIIGTTHDVIGATLGSGALVYTVPNPDFDPTQKATATPPVNTSPAVGTNPQYLTVAFDLDTDDANGSVAMALAAANEIIGKLWRMEDTPLVNGVEMTLSQYWFRPPRLNLGGYVENPQSPSAIPFVPDYFVSTAYPPVSTQTIFDELASINPQCFSSTGQTGGLTSISWLRDADTIEYQRTWFKVTSKWLGAPIGAWDADLYSAGGRPTLPSDYRQLVFA